MDRGGSSNHRRTDRGGRARVRFATVRSRHDAPGRRLHINRDSGVGASAHVRRLVGVSRSRRRPAAGRRRSSGNTTRPACWRCPGAADVPSDGAVLALANTCRHRGHEILPAGAADSRKALICPYHAWNYALDGSLAKAPGFDRVPGFEAFDYGLVRLPSAVWHGWVFVNAIGDGPSLADHVGDLDTLVAPYHPETLLRRARLEYEVAANWKVVVENYHECYHCPRIHPELCRVSPPTSGANFDLPGSWVGGSMELRAGATTMSLSGASDATPIDGVDPRVVLYLGCSQLADLAASRLRHDTPADAARAGTDQGRMHVVPSTTLSTRPTQLSSGI